MAFAVALEHKTKADLPDLKFLAMAYPIFQLLDLRMIPHRMYDRYDAPIIITTGRSVKLLLYYIFGFDGPKYVDDFLANNHTHYSVQKSKFAEYVSYKNLPEHERNLYVTEPPQSLGSREDALSLEVTQRILNPLIAGLMASDEQLQRLPPTLHITCEHDFAAHDGLLLISRLKKIGIDLVHLHYKGYPHGFIIPIDFLDAAQQAWLEVVGFVKDRL